MLIRKDLFNQLLNMAMNSAEYLNEKENGEWITIKGNHIYIKEGQDVKELFDKFIAHASKKKKGKSKKEDKPKDKTSKGKSFNVSGDIKKIGQSVKSLSEEEDKRK